MFGEAFLNITNGIVAEVTCKPATKTRQVCLGGNFETFEIGINKIKWIILIGFNDPALEYYLIDW